MLNKYPVLSISLIILLFSFSRFYAQGLTETGFETGAEYDANTEWGDYDNDGDLDILYVKNTNYEDGTVAIWRNNGNGTFSSISIGIPYSGLLDVKWSDYDNDGDLDLAVTGSITEKISKLYKNNGSGVFTEANVGLQGLSKGRCAWGDYNNDGKPDLYLTGLDEYDTPVAILYKNEGSDVFTATDIEIRPSIEGFLEWGDYNNDEYLDLLIHGRDFNGNQIADIYKNTGSGEFIPINADFTMPFCRDLAMGDYDEDGDMDVVFGSYNSGYDPDDKGINIFRNDGNDLFTQIDLGSFQSLSAYSLDWGDSDNDGDLDLLANGSILGTYQAIDHIENLGGDVFQAISSSNSTLEFAGEWGDFDNDNDLDMVISVANGKIGILRNDASATNTPPTTPGGLSSSNASNGVVLSWNAASDNSTNSQSLTYNIRIGTSPGAGDILSGMAAYPSGTRKVAAFGNAGYDTDYLIKNLPSGTYYWTVQSIDNSYRGSGFASVQSFEVLPTAQLVSQIFPVGSDYGLAWGDYNNDGYKDLAMIQYSSSGGSVFNVWLYKNNGDDSFSYVNATFPNVYTPSLSWGDYDNDGDLDLVISGAENSYRGLINKTYVFRNDGGDVFREQYLGIYTFGKETKFADLDNDGDQDLVIDDVLYENENGYLTQKYSFTENGFLLDVGDFDNDMDMDLLMRFNNSTKIMINEGSWNFIESQASLPSIYGRVFFNEFDNDGDLDIMLAGSAEGLNTATILRNDEGVYTDTESGLRGVQYAYGVSGDYNNDGFTDLFYTGLSGDFITKVYLNNSDHTFTDLHLSLPVTGSNNVSHADFDNDGDLDFFVTDYSGPSKLYRNNLNFPETKPDMPGNLQWENFGNGVKLSWTRPTNISEGESGLTYNIRVGTSPGAIDIVSSMNVTPSSSQLLIPQKGNVDVNTSWRFDALEVGDYYWSVQAVTPSYNGGSWADEQIFTVSKLRPFFSSDTVCSGLLTSFTDQTVVSGSTVTSWSWEFGDGSTSTDQHPTHTYAAPGTYTVTLTVMDAVGASEKTTGEVMVLPKPLASFTVSDVCIGSQTSITNTSSIDTLMIDNWSWDLGNGTFSALPQPADYGYLNTGGYDIKLRIDALNGCSDSLISRIEVAEYPNANIGIAVGYKPEFCEGGEVKMEVEDNSNYSYKWKIDGGMISGADSSVITTSTSGDYTVRVTNQTAACSSESDLPIRILVVPSPAQPLIQSSGLNTFCEGDSTILSVANIPGNSYQWRLNEGAVGNDSSTYIAMASGSYTLDVTNSTGCTVSSLNSIDVSVIAIPDVPTLQYSGPTSFCEGDSVSMSISEPGTEAYQWYNDFGQIAGESGTSYTANNSGTYWVNARNVELCESSSIEALVVETPIPGTPVIETENYILDECQDEDAIILSVQTEEAGVVYQWKRNGFSLEGENGSSLIGFLQEGDYTVEAISSACIVESEALTIQYREMPDKPEILAEGPVIWYLASTNDSASEYRWYMNGQRIDGADEYLYVAGRQEGKFEVSLSKEGSCFTKSDPVWIPLGTGVDQDIWQDLRIYPNPSPGKFFLEMDNNIMGELIIDLFDESGRQMINIKFHKETSHFKTEIDLSGQPAGVYFIGMRLDEHYVNRTLVVE